MIQIQNKIMCSGCMACYNICQHDAIYMEEDHEGFWYPTVIASKCVQCGLCNEVCPYISDLIPKIDIEKCYAGYNIDAYERSISSSGGIFIALAKYIIKEGGVVFGAAYDESFLAFHKGVSSYSELIQLVGSKYMQSRTNYSFRAVKKILLDNRAVLFSGTACQIAGLKGYLGREYDNLYTVDFICLGVPSPKVWKDYLTTYFDISNIKYVNFKDKSLGWHTFSLRIDDPEKKIKNGRSTYFFTGYFRQLYSRPCCNTCYFKGKNRVSDITISDCWGYKVIAPELDDNKGLSSIIGHTSKGLELLKMVDGYLILKESQIEDIQKYNKYSVSEPAGINRTSFWEDYYKMPKDKVFKKYCKPKMQFEHSKLYRKLIAIRDKVVR